MEIMLLGVEEIKRRGMREEEGEKQLPPSISEYDIVKPNALYDGSK